MSQQSKSKSKMYVSLYTCDVCNVEICTDDYRDNRGLDSFYCYSTYTNKENHMHFCKDHTKAISQYINTLIQSNKLNVI
jgi:hypothetical protein